MPRFIKTTNLENEKQTMAEAKRFAPYLSAGDIVLFRGELGAGKTSFVRGIIHALCGEVEVPSPTYTLVQTYETADFDIWHFDLYRLENPADVWALGLEDAFDGMCLIEWPERIENLLSGEELELRLDFAENGRTLGYYGNKDWEKRLASL